jgi:hypothetical protein
MRTLKKGDRVRILNSIGANWLSNGEICRVSHVNEYKINGVFRHYEMRFVEHDIPWAALPIHFQVLGIQEYYEALCGCV